MNTIKTLCLRNDEYGEYTTLIAFTGDEEPIIQDFLKMGRLFEERINAAEGLEGIEKMKEAFLREFPYFLHKGDLGNLINFFPRREDFFVRELVHVVQFAPEGFPPGKLVELPGPQYPRRTILTLLKAAEDHQQQSIQIEKPTGETT